MPEKEIGNAGTYTQWLLQLIPVMLAVGLASLGGVISYLNRIDKAGVAFNLFRFLLEIVTSGFVGIISFVLCDAADLSWSTTAAIVAISGHMGTRALFLIENTAINVATNILKRNGYDNSKTEASPEEETSSKTKRAIKR